MLPLPTVRKLLRECFPDDQLEHVGIISVSDAELQSWMQRLQKRFDTLPLCSAEFVERRSGLMYVTIGISTTEDEYPDDRFEVQQTSHDDTHGIWISDFNYRRKTTAPPAPVCDIAQIETFVQAVKDRIARDALRNKRNEKVTGLKKTGLTARLTELGAEHGFSFAIGQSTRDINLSIRVLGRKKGYHFAFPKGKLDAVIEQVPDLVAMLQKLQLLGVSFRTNNRKWVDRQGEWIEAAESVDEDIV